MIMHGQWSSPVYAEPNGKPMVIFPGGDGWIRAFNPPDGALIWKFDCNPKESVYTLGPEATRNDFVSTPVIYKNKLYIGVGQDPEHGKGVGHLWCIDITKEPKNKDKDLSPAASRGQPGKPQTISTRRIRRTRIPASSGTTAATPRTISRPRILLRPQLSSCCVHDGLVYAAEFAGYRPLPRRRDRQGLLGA